MNFEGLAVEFEEVPDNFEMEDSERIRDYERRRKLAAFTTCGRVIRETDSGLFIMKGNGIVVYRSLSDVRFDDPAKVHKRLDEVCVCIGEDPHEPGTL